MSPKDVPDEGSIEDVRKALEQEQKGLKRFVFLKIRDPQDREDVLNDAAARILRVAKVPLAKPGAYFLRITMYVIREYWERGETLRRFFAHDVTPEDLSERLAADIPALEDAAVRGQRVELLDQAILTLTPRQQVLIHLTYFVGLTVEVAGRYCGVSRRTATNDLRDAHLRMYEFFNSKERGS